MMSGHLSRRGAVLAAALGTAALAPAAASAATQPATLAVDQPCYVVAPKAAPMITLTGSGYAPGDPVSITDSQGGIDTRTVAGPTGQITMAVPAPLPFLTKPGVKKDTITAADFTATGGEIVGTAVANLTRFDFGENGARKAPGLRAFTEKTTWLFSGLPSGRTIYGHYTYDGKVTARQAFGRAQGPCGVLTVRKRLYPATPHHRAYTIQVDSSKKYSRRTVPSGRLKLSLTIF
jgi:hypothetical protein